MGGYVRRPSSPFSLKPGARPLALQHVEAGRVALHMPLKEVFTAGHRDGICSCIELRPLVEILGTLGMSAARALSGHAFCQLGQRERTVAASLPLQLHGLIPWGLGMLHCKPT